MTCVYNDTCLFSQNVNITMYYTLISVNVVNTDLLAFLGWMLQFVVVILDSMH